MEGRLDSYWYFGFEALKRKAAYVMANFRGEIDEMRNIQLNFGEPLSQAQAKENAETDAWRTQREKSMKVKSLQIAEHSEAKSTKRSFTSKIGI